MLSSQLEHEVILILEDSHLDSMLIQRITESHGGVSFVARSFQEAAVIASQLKVTAMTIDLDLGGPESGLEIVWRLSQMLGDSFQPRMLVVTGKELSEAEQVLQKKLPLTGIMSKPVAADELARLLGRSPSSNASASTSAAAAQTRSAIMVQ